MTTLVQLALPIMGTALIQMAYNLVDMVWIGKLGSGAVAAVGTAGMFMWLSTGFTVLSRMGGQVHTAQKLGADQVVEAGKYAQNAIQLGTLLSVAYTVVIHQRIQSLAHFHFCPLHKLLVESNVKQHCRSMPNKFVHPNHLCIVIIKRNHILFAINI